MIKDYRERELRVLAAARAFSDEATRHVNLGMMPSEIIHELYDSVRELDACICTVGSVFVNPKCCAKEHRP